MAKTVNLNNMIVQLIRAARNERGITQIEMADHLKKTQATISDLERGNVQVSASELYQIAHLLNKPIEYFYGEEIGNKEAQDIIALTRKQSKKDRENTLQINSILLEMENLTEELAKYPPGEEVPIELMQQFYNLFVPFVTTLKAMSQKLEEMRDKFDEEMKLHKLNQPKDSIKKKPRKN